MQLNYTLDLDIEAPIDFVVSTYLNRDLYPVWQPGRIESERITNDPHPTYEVLIQMGRRKMKIKEEILTSQLPGKYEVKSRMKGIRHYMKLSFSAEGKDRTKWVCREEFTFTGLMILVAFFHKEGFYKQSKIIMKNFKNYTEAQYRR